MTAPKDPPPDPFTYPNTRGVADPFAHLLVSATPPVSVIVPPVSEISVIVQEVPSAPVVTPALVIFKKRYACSVCLLEFNKKSNILKHFEKQFTCKHNTDDDPNLYIVETLFTNCPYCTLQIKTIAESNFMKKHLDHKY